MRNRILMHGLGVSRSFAVLLAALLAVSVAGPVSAQAVAAGPGGQIVGDGEGLFPVGPPSYSGQSSVVLAEPVEGVVAITIYGLTFSRGNRLQVTLVDPLGREHNVVMPINYLGGGPAPYNDVDITVVEWGAEKTFVQCSSDPALCASYVPEAGIYDQVFTSDASVWTNGQDGIYNTDLCAVVGPPGSWRLRFYAYDTLAVGSYDGWTMSYGGQCRSGGEGHFCPGGDRESDCPCGNNGGEFFGIALGCVGSGKHIPSASPSGAYLFCIGASLLQNDDVILSAGGLPLSSPALLFYGPQRQKGVPWGAGLLCAGGGAVRVQTGAAVYPGAVAFGPGLGAATAAVAGQVQHFQVMYRDLNGPCDGALFNFTNGWTVHWY